MFSLPQEKEHSGQYLLLWTDLLQKTVMGVPDTTPPPPRHNSHTCTTVTFFCPQGGLPQEKENSWQYLLLRTDILQKTVIGGPWNYPPTPPHNSNTLTTVTFFCPQGGCCGCVWLYNILARKWKNTYLNIIRKTFSTLAAVSLFPSKA